MLRERDRAAYLALHPYAYVNTERSEDGRHVQLHLASRARTDEVLCPSCGRTFCEEIPFRHPQTRVTGRAAAWAGSFLRLNLPIATVQRITGIHWETTHRIQKELMDGATDGRRREPAGEGYRPKRLAVDAFAIHKGHRYATCVMDLDTGDVLWAGRGRTKADFSLFFEEMARLSGLRDEHAVREGWTAWSKGTEENGIPALEKLARLKEKRLEGLVAHAVHPISTGKLEGFNNRIKVAKRIGYGYRNKGYFFSPILYISIPSIRCKSHKRT